MKCYRNKIILINESFSAYKTNLQIKYQTFMRGLHVYSATFLKRGKFCDFLFIYLDGNPSKKGIEVRLYIIKLCSFFVVTLVSESTSGLDVWLCHSVQSLWMGG